MNYSDNYLTRAHKASFKNMDELRNDTLCGCFYCMKIFSPKEIKETVEENDRKETALCPYCEIDSVIGKSTGFPITKSFLSVMCSKYF